MKYKYYLYVSTYIHLYLQKKNRSHSNIFFIIHYKNINLILKGNQFHGQNKQPPMKWILSDNYELYSTNTTGQFIEHRSNQRMSNLWPHTKECLSGSKLFFFFFVNGQALPLYFAWPNIKLRSSHLHKQWHSGTNPWNIFCPS